MWKSPKFLMCELKTPQKPKPQMLRMSPKWPLGHL